MIVFKRKYHSQSIYGTGYVWKLEKAFEGYLDNMHRCISVSNATTGIMAVLEILKINNRSSVVCNALGWGGTIAGVLKRGSKIIFADFDRKTFSISPGSLHSILSRNNEVRAVIDVDFLGLPSRSADILDICNQHKVPYILDCANSFGTISNEGGRSGCLADFAVYSLNAQKNLSAGEGGLVCVKRDEYYYKLIELTQHPDRQKRDLPGLVKVNQFGMNYRIHPDAAFRAYSNFNRTLKRIDKKRKQIEERYPFIRDYYGAGSSPNYNFFIVGQNVLQKYGFPDFNLRPFILKNYFLPEDPYLCNLANRIESWVSIDPCFNSLLIRLG
jgi:perosamine synthetase